MKKHNLEFKQKVIGQVLKGKTSKTEAAQILGCKLQTIYRLLERVRLQGFDALKDRRHSNNYKLSPKQLLGALKTKGDGSWRSARKTLELTGIQNVTTRRIQQIWVEHGLSKLNVERLKPITRFVAKEPNDLWQADIMGKIYFPYLGDAYLIANLDDCSRFILGAKWFSRQNQMNVFRIWYHCLFRWGLPGAMLQDKGSQYRSTNPKGQATYQFYAQVLGIKLIFAHKARTKGKIERIWRFIQQDFVRENLKVKSFQELNLAFFKWQVKYNEEFKSDGLGMHKRTPASVYQPSERRKPKQELQELLTIQLRRFVYSDSTISLFGIRYKIPTGYIKCRIWLKLKGDKVTLESMGKIFFKFRLKV